MGLPSIVVEFLKKAKTAITRSQRGIVCLVMIDSTKEEKKLQEFKEDEDVIQEEWTEDNYKALQDALLDGPSKVYALRLGEGETFSDAIKTLDTIKFNWLAFIDEDQEDIDAYIKARNKKGGSTAVKAAVAGKAADNTHVVNFGNKAVKRKTDKEKIPGYKYLGRIVGMLAATPMDRSCTYYELEDLDEVEEPEDIDDAIDKGEFILFNDYGKIKVARGVNSATTVDKEDEKKITVIEGMDLIREDIMETFKNQYIGKYKNNLDNQMVFVAAVISYFRQLAMENVLDSGFQNTAQIDVEKQRKAWIDSGETEAMDWDDEKVKKMTFRSFVFLLGSAKILDAIEDLDFGIYMN